MKKIIYILSLVVVSISFQSCTDESTERIEENEKFELQLIDKNEIENPRDK